MIWNNIIPQLKTNTTKLHYEEFNEIFFKYVRKAMLEKVRKERKGVHVTNMTACPRNDVYRMFDEDYELDEAAAQYIITGAVAHGFIQEVAPFIKRDNEDRYDIEKKVTLGSLEGHIDFYDRVEHMPVEMKTARKDLRELLQFGPSSGYLLQLALYTLFTNSPRGLLYYNLLAQKKSDFHHGFIMTLPEELRRNILNEINRIKLNYEKAVAKKDPQIADGVYDNPELNFQCERCPYADEIRCKEGYKAKIKRLEDKAKKTDARNKGFYKPRKSQILTEDETLVKSPKAFADWTPKELEHINIVK
jgi:hypothetical protein